MRTAHAARDGASSALCLRSTTWPSRDRRRMRRWEAPATTSMKGRGAPGEGALRAFFVQGLLSTARSLLARQPHCGQSRSGGWQKARLGRVCRVWRLNPDIQDRARPQDLLRRVGGQRRGHAMHRLCARLRLSLRLRGCARLRGDGGRAGGGREEGALRCAASRRLRLDRLLGRRKDRRTDRAHGRALWLTEPSPNLRRAVSKIS